MGIPSPPSHAGSTIWEAPTRMEQVCSFMGDCRDARLRYLADADGVQVLWWNIEHGLQTRRLRERTGVSPLDVNLRELAREAIAPDVIALGEFTRDALEPATLAELQKRFPYGRFIPYNAFRSDLGILLASRFPITDSVFRAMDYTSPDAASEADRQRYRDEWGAKMGHDPRDLVRTYIRADLELSEGRTLSVVPVHLIEPWEAMKKERGALRTGWNVFFGIDNPLMYQLMRLKSFLMHDFGEHLESRRAFTMFGDFNMPREYWPLGTTVGYEVTSIDLADAFANAGGGYAPTFPSPASPPAGEDYPLMRIDHAFANRGSPVLAADTLSLAGSDHYPISWVISVPR